MQSLSRGNRRIAQWSRLVLGLAAATTLASSTLVAQRAPARQSDLQGTWDNATATPLVRPKPFADKAHFTREEADAFEKDNYNRILSGFSAEDRLASDLNETYQETADLKVVDDLRTSLIVDPPDGQLPAPLPQVQARIDARPKRNYDDPETLTLDERCLMAVGSGSSSGAPPLVPNPFGQNLYQIVQTQDRVLIFAEMVHDARVIRLNGTHLPPSIRQWTGDSIGHWEGNTLVVETQNLEPGHHWIQSGVPVGEALRIVERWKLTEGGKVLEIQLKMTDPQYWEGDWISTKRYNLRDDRDIFEVHCIAAEMAKLPSAKPSANRK